MRTELGGKLPRKLNRPTLTSDLNYKHLDNDKLNLTTQLQSKKWFGNPENYIKIVHIYRMFVTTVCSTPPHTHTERSAPTAIQHEKDVELNYRKFEADLGIK